LHLLAPPPTVEVIQLVAIGGRRADAGSAADGRRPVSVVPVPAGCRRRQLKGVSFAASDN